MGYKTLELKIIDKVAIITLNRPDDANSLNLEMANELLEIATICDSDPNTRAVVLTANGKMFSGGGDLPSFKKQGDKLSEYLRLTTTGLHMAISRFKRMNAPFIVAVNGTAAGAGFSIAISGDLVFSSDSARFTVAYTKIGVSPDGGSTWMLPRIVGEKKAMELMLLNPVLKAEEALQLGLISRIYPEADLHEESFKVACRLAAGPSLAFGETKRLLADSSVNSMEHQLELETRAIAGLARYSKDTKEGIGSFIDKRAPEFKGE